MKINHIIIIHIQYTIYPSIVWTAYPLYIDFSESLILNINAQYF